MTIELEASPASACAQWRGGRYDVLDEILAFRAITDDQTVVQRSAGMSTWYLGFNAQRAPLDDARVRRALAHAIDRRGPAEPLRAAATAAGGLLAPTMPGHSHRVSPEFDTDRAHPLLSQAGYARGRNLGEIVLACLDLWRTRRPTWPPNSRQWAFEFDFCPPPPIPIWTPRSRSTRTPTSGGGVPTPRSGRRRPRSNPPRHAVALPRRGTRGAACSRGLALRPRRAPAQSPSASTGPSRPWSRLLIRPRRQAPQSATRPPVSRANFRLNA